MMGNRQNIQDTSNSMNQSSTIYIVVYMINKMLKKKTEFFRINIYIEWEHWEDGQENTDSGRFDLCLLMLIV